MAYALRRFVLHLGLTGALCLLMAGCNPFRHKKPDPTKGVVTGVVLCADTGRPARFATVMLTPAPVTDARAADKQDQPEPLPAAETTITDLDGRFRLEAVEPGHYYAFATLEGYLDPALGLDPDRLSAETSDRERNLDAVAQWREHLALVSVGVRHISDVSLVIQRAAEISGAVTFDDGSPAIGLHFLLARKAEKGAWVPVGFARMDSWTLQAQSDGHGHFVLSNLAGGEYRLCALMPAEEESAAPRICYGNVLRSKNAKTLKVAQGEAFGGADIEIPLAGMHAVSGLVTALPDAHAVKHATVRLLYSDDRETARETTVDDDGAFSFAYVSEGTYLVQVTAARDEDEKPADAADEASKPLVTRIFRDKEVPINVAADSEMNISVAPITPAATPSQ